MSKHSPKCNSLKNIIITPKVWKNFGGCFMHKKHDYSELLKDMHMFKDGYFNSVRGYLF